MRWLTQSTARASDPQRTHARELMLQSLLMEYDRRSRLEPSPDTLTPGEQHRQQIVQEVMRWIGQRSPSVSVAQVARHAGYSSDHLTRLFKQVRGVSLQEYLIGHRIRQARQLLRESTLSVTQIADRLGYRDVYFFSRQFRQMTKETPTQWRHRLRAMEHAL